MASPCDNWALRMAEVIVQALSSEPVIQSLAAPQLWKDALLHVIGLHMISRCLVGHLTISGHLTVSGHLCCRLL